MIDLYKEIRKNPGFFNFEYNIRSPSSGIKKDSLLIKIVSIEEIIKILRLKIFKFLYTAQEPRFLKLFTDIFN